MRPRMFSKASADKFSCKYRLLRYTALNINFQIKTIMPQQITHQTTPEELFERLNKIKQNEGVCYDDLIKKCGELVPKINEINRLKAEKNAVILVHTYVNPEIIYGVGDYVGDSYALSKNAMETDAPAFVFAAVRFMGETAKILNPHKEVLLPALEDGCTLADAITAEQVRELCKEFPKHTFVCYINTTAEVKAECDVCVTSANVTKVVSNIPNDKIYFLPDKMMGQNLITALNKLGIKKEIKYFNGTCYVHEEYPLEQLMDLKERFPHAVVAAHPECRPEVCEQADFVGSTSQMFEFLKNSNDKEFIMLTECGLSSRLNIEFPDKRIVGMCTFCKYMKSNTLDDIIRVLKNPQDRDIVRVDDQIRERALTSLEAMFKYTEM